MKPFLVHYTYWEQPRTARVVADTVTEAEARFFNAHPRGCQIERVEPMRRPPPPPVPPPRAPVVHVVRLDPEQQERVLEEARRLTAELRATLFPDGRPQP